MKGMDDKSLRQQVTFQQAQTVRTGGAGPGNRGSQCGPPRVGFKFSVQGEIKINRGGFELVTAMIPHTLPLNRMRSIANQSSIDRTQM